MQPAALDNSIGFVVKFLWIDSIKVTQGIFFEQFSMEFGNPVYRMATNDSQMSHVDLIVFDDPSIFNDLRSNPATSHFCHIAVINFQDNLIDPRQDILKEFSIPLFQSFR